MRILTQLARPGVTLAQAVVTADGLPLFGKGTQLTRRHLRSLYEDGVKVLRVVDDGTMEDWETVPEVPAYASALDARFERVADDRDMQALKRAVKRVYVDFLLELEDAWSRYVDIADPPPTETPESQQLLDAIGRRMLRRRVDALKSLPTFPESVIRINQILAAEDTDESFERIAAVIEIDPVLTARVLRLVNSAFYGVSGAVATVYDALVMLGLDVVKGIILSTNAMDLLSSGLGGLRGLWEHCFGAAVAAGALARVLGLSGAAELSAAALMHDIGKVVLATQLPGDYAEVVEYARQKRCPVIEAETALLGVGHDEIGKWLVTRWKLPAALAEPIALHHTPEKATRHAEATAVVHVADAMVRAYGFGFPGDPVMPDPSPHAWRLLRLNRSKIEEAVERMHRRLQGALAKANLYDELAG